MQDHDAARYSPADDASGEPGGTGSTREHAPRSGRWAVAHRCTHCPYTHLVAFLEEPQHGKRYGYICPVTALESIFAADDVVSSQLPQRLGVEEEVGVAGTVGGVIWGHRVRDN